MRCFIALPLPAEARRSPGQAGGRGALGVMDYRALRAV